MNATALQMPSRDTAEQQHWHCVSRWPLCFRWISISFTKEGKTVIQQANGGEIKRTRLRISVRVSNGKESRDLIKS